jgi:hemerythrin
MAIEWDDSYRIDDDEINHQHQTLFRYVNDFLSATSSAEMTLCVIHLFKYTRQHFAYEEELMRKVGFPHYEQHLRMHDRLVSRLGALGDSIVQSTMDRAELEVFISDWALGHIPNADAQLARYLRERD